RHVRGPARTWRSRAALLHVESVRTDHDDMAALGPRAVRCRRVSTTEIRWGFSEASASHVANSLRCAREALRFLPLGALGVMACDDFDRRQPVDGDTVDVLAGEPAFGRRRQRGWSGAKRTVEPVGKSRRAAKLVPQRFYGLPGVNDTRFTRAC